MIEIRMTRARAMMAQQGLSVSELADRAQVSRANLNMCLNGKNYTGKYVCECVSEALGWDGPPREVFDTITLREAG